jgi:hypothetical protein
MGESCRTCEYFCDNYYISLPLQLAFDIPITDKNGNTIIKRSIPMVKNDEGTGICNNTYSKMYESGISSGGYCECYMKKKKEDKKDNFSVFDNYKCDGQLLMKFNENNIEFIEEKEDKVVTNNIYI